MGAPKVRRLADERAWQMLGYLGSDARVCEGQPDGFATTIRNAWLYVDGRVAGEPHFPDPYISVTERRELQAAAGLPADQKMEILTMFAVAHGASEKAVREVVAGVRRLAAADAPADAPGVRRVRAVER